VKFFKVYDANKRAPFFVAGTGNLPPNMQLVAKSRDVDTRKDLEWFRRHPGTRQFRRRPSKLEMRALSMPATARVLVTLDACGECWREYWHRND